MYRMRSKEPWEVFFYSLTSDAKNARRATQVIRLGGERLPTLDDAETARRRAEMYALNALEWGRLESALACTYMVEALLRWLRDDGWDEDLLKHSLMHAQASGRDDATHPGCLLRATDRILEQLRLTLRAGESLSKDGWGQ
jgi:hypothetical protein